MIRIFFRSEGLWMRAVDELRDVSIAFNQAVHRGDKRGGYSIELHFE